MLIRIETAKGTVYVRFGWAQVGATIALAVVILVGVALVFCFG